MKLIYSGILNSVFIPLLTSLPVLLMAQETKPAPAASAASTSLTEQELQLQKTLTNVTFDGSWNLVEDGKLSEAKADKYQIVKLDKTPGGWKIVAKLAYGGQEFEIPLPVKFAWAGDTAVMIVDNLAMPGGSKYSARLLIYERTYAGSWSGGGKTGVLSGVIVPQAK
jgi:hypothetical protein